MDAWSDGQVGSKLWLCQSLENHFSNLSNEGITIWIYGSWYGTLAYMLLSRERLNIRKICCFDIDKKANEIAYKVLDHWRCQGVSIEIYDQDCQKLDGANSLYQSSRPDLIINTSCEHMKDYDWWRNIPSGQLVALQSTDMKHPTHINNVMCIQDFKDKTKMSKIMVESVKEFAYPTLQFKRFMLIGEK